MFLFYVCSLIVFVLTVYGASKTSISINGVNFQINGEVTYKNAKDSNVHGLLLNSRMINAIFDNSNDTYNYLFVYPDTKKWDPTRNVKEFIGNLSTYKSYGMLSFTVGLQGGNPFGYGRNEPNNISGQPWVNTAYNVDTGALNKPYFDRLDKILDEADNIGMTPIVQMFYGAQIGKLGGDTVIMTAINNTLDWFMQTGYTNFLIEVTNECNLIHNDILGEDGMPNTIKYIRKYTNNRYLIGSSTTNVPNDALITASDMILIHGNGDSSSTITSHINSIRASSAYKNKPKPIIFNEDDHYAFTASSNNMKSAIEGHASWGIFVDCNQTTAGDYHFGYQCVPAAWNLNTPIKQGFFDAVKNYTS